MLCIPEVVPMFQLNLAHILNILRKGFPVMKHKLLLLFVAAVSLFIGCTAPAAPTEPPKPASWLMEYPGLTWGMTPEEARAALEVTDEQQSTGDYLVLHDIRRTVFGAENADIYLYFIDLNGDDAWHLSQVMVALPHDADLDAIAQQIEAHYSSAPEYTEKEMTDTSGFPTTARRWNWASDALQQDTMSEDDLKSIKELDEFYQRILTEPATTITLTNNSYFDLTLDGISTKNLLTINTMFTTHQLEGGYADSLNPSAATE